MTAAQNRVERLYQGLSARERAVLCLKWWKEGAAQDPPGFFRATPDYRLIRLFNATHRETTWFAFQLRHRLEAIGQRLALLRCLHLWAQHAERLRQQIEWFSGEPVTRTEYERLLAEARDDLLPLEEAAELLLDDEPDGDEMDDDAWDQRQEEIAARLRQLVSEGLLEAESGDDDPMLRVGSFYDWRDQPVPVIPEHGRDFAVFPDEAAAEVEKLREHRQQLRGLLDQAPHWPPAEAFEPPEGEAKRTPSMLPDGLPLALANQLTETLSELLAVEQVVAEVAERFAGEEPIHPDARKLLEELQAVALRLVDDLQPEKDVDLPAEPNAQVVTWLRSLIHEEDA